MKYEFRRRPQYRKQHLSRAQRIRVDTERRVVELCEVWQLETKRRIGMAQTQNAHCVELATPHPFCTQAEKVC